MVQERIPMDVVMEVLKLTYQEKLSNRKIAQRLGISRPTVRKYQDQAREGGIDQWPLSEDTDGGVERLRKALFREKTVSVSGMPLPEWSQVEKELRSGKKNGVTRRLLWQEYRMAHPKGFSYSQYCAHYKEFRKRDDLRIHLPHAPGEELYIDYSGPKVLITPITGKPIYAAIFVAVMGLSSYTFAYATEDMKTPSWTEANRQTFEYLGGVPLAVIPDCTKTAVITPHRIDPRLNRTYREMSAHYGFLIAPARPLSPRDKGTVENGVLTTQRALLAPLRHIKFTSIDALNRALRIRCDAFNREPFQERPGTRLQVFEEEDRPALAPLPSEPFETEAWITCRVHPDYHIATDHFLYSVPCRLVGENVDVRLTKRTVEIFYREEGVASHLRNTDPRHRFSTCREHMPPNHRGYLDQSQKVFLDRAEQVGQGVVLFFQSLFLRRHYPPQAYRTCQGVLGLLKDYVPERLNAACDLAVQMQSGSYRDVQGILKTGADRKIPETPKTGPALPTHENVRGKRYYAGRPAKEPGNDPGSVCEGAGKQATVPVTEELLPDNRDPVPFEQDLVRITQEQDTGRTPWP